MAIIARLDGFKRKITYIYIYQTLHMRNQENWWEFHTDTDTSIFIIASNYIRSFKDSIHNIENGNSQN